jgi:hypothetical protein
LYQAGQDMWGTVTARMLRETELYLEEHLRRPPEWIIPTVEVGKAGFPRGYADAFWSQVLATS